MVKYYGTRNFTNATVTGAGITSVVADTSPELGGELDCGAHSIGFTEQAATGDGTTNNNFFSLSLGAEF